MHFHEYLILAGIMVSVCLAFGGFYNSVIERRFKAIEEWLRHHDEHFERVNYRCVEEVAQVNIVATKIDGIDARLERVENKLDWLMDKNGRNAKASNHD